MAPGPTKVHRCDRSHGGMCSWAFEEESRRLARQTGHPLLGAASLHAGTIRGGSAPSVYPDRCHLVVERRTLPGESGGERDDAKRAAVLGVAGERCPGLDARVEAGLFRAGTEVPVTSGLVEGLVSACRRAGLPGVVEGMTAWVDACFLNESGTPAVCFGPGSIAQAHTADEWVEASEIEACARILTDFSRRFLQS